MIELPYGRERLRLDLPPGVRPTVIERPAFPLPPTPEGVIREASRPRSARPRSTISPRAGGAPAS